MSLAAVASSFIGGAASTCFFHRPSLNKAGIRVLVSGGLQGTALLVASAVLSLAASKLYDSISGDKKEGWGFNIFIGTFIASAIAVPIAAKTLTHLLGTSTEAFVNFAVSFVCAVVGHDIAKKVK